MVFFESNIMPKRTRITYNLPKNPEAHQRKALKLEHEVLPAAHKSKARQHPINAELMWQATVNQKKHKGVFFDTENPTHIQQLETQSGITMLGDVQTRKDWKALVYKSNEGYNFGLIAKEDIKKGTVIVPYLGKKEKITPDQEYTQRQLAYVFEFDKNHSVFADQSASIAAFGNHNESIPNIFAKVIDGEIKYIALEDIAAGTALLIDYSFTYIYSPSFTYLSPYQNGRTPAENFRDYRDWFDPICLRLNSQLKRHLTIETSDAEYCFVPKIYSRPSLVREKGKTKFIKHLHLPVYLMKDGMILAEQPYIFPLMLACALKDYNKIMELLDIDADVFAKTQKGISALNILTNGLTLEDTQKRQCNKALQAILKEILIFYKGIYTKKNFGQEHSKEQLETLKMDRFVEYVILHVTNPIALDIIAKLYNQCTFKKVEALSTVQSTSSPQMVDVVLNTNNLNQDSNENQPVETQPCVLFTEPQKTTAPNQATKISLPNNMYSFFEVAMKVCTTICSIPFNSSNCDTRKNDEHNAL